MPTRLSYTGDEPVTVEEAKLAARVDTDALDAEVEGLITAAREQAEHITGRCYRGQVLREELADWPADTDAIAVHAATACEVRYWTGSAWSAPLNSGFYEYAPGGIGNNATVLAPAAGTSWPALAERAVGPRVRIDLTAGPASAAAVPEQVKRYIKAMVSAWIVQPEALVDGRLQPNPLLARLLDAERLWH